MLESDDDKATVDYASADAPCRRRPLNQTGGQAGFLAGHMEVVGAHGVLIARPAPNCLPACSHSLLRTSEKETGAVRRRVRKPYARRGRRARRTRLPPPLLSWSPLSRSPD